MALSNYELLDSTTLSSNASSVTFSSISQSYRDLIVVAELTGSSEYSAMRFNGDSASNYNNIFFRAGNGTTTQSVRSTSTFLYMVGFVTASTSQAQLVISQIMDYSATDKHKPVLTRGNKDDTVEGSICRWANTNAITTVQMFLHAGGNFTTGSTFYLYGVAG